MPDLEQCKGLLITVGGTPNPVAFSINHHQPEKVMFFTSLASRSEIEDKVRPLATHRWTDQEIITTDDAQDLTRCLEVLRDELPRRLSVLRLTMEDLMVDYTGGTKTMSAALVLACINAPVRYSYVGGTVRTKGDLGVVLDGSEAVIVHPNPWDILAVDLRRRLARQFNRAHFAEARETADEAARVVGDRWRPFYIGVRDLCEAYHRWSNFDYLRAIGPLRKSTHALDQYAQAANNRSFLGFLTQIKGELKRLEVIAPTFEALQQGKGAPALEHVKALIIDLVSNAERMTRLAGRPDDGVARLYSALEKHAKAELLHSKLAIDSSAAHAEQIPESLRDEYVKSYQDPNTASVKFGSLASYRLLAEVNHPVGQRFHAREQDLRKLLDVRNNSFMVHGWKPIKEDAYEKLRDVTLDFLELSTADLPALPNFPES